MNEMGHLSAQLHRLSSTKKKGKRKAVRDEEIHYQIMPGDYFNGWVERGAAEDTEEKKKGKKDRKCPQQHLSGFSLLYF